MPSPIVAEFVTRLTPEIAARFAEIALGHVTREYPQKLDHVLDGDGDAVAPRLLHPIFHGSFDWHSCVHGYWLLAGVLRRYPDLAVCRRIEDLFDASFTLGKVHGEIAYLRRPSSAGFERPYGWAWLLKLQAELSGLGNHRWAAALRPLAEAFADRFVAWLPKADYPVRAGVHANTAFALRLAADYAETYGDLALMDDLRDKALAWYAGDADCQAWEPGGDEFLSPALIEAECLRRLLPAPDFRVWFRRFLPRVAERSPASLFIPAKVSDRSDGKIAHLDGTNLSRAWCWRGIAAGVGVGPLRPVALAAAEDHLAASLPQVASDYMGEHWLASFALLALTG
jgi:hypothetical protein